jgi:hypothetical protein
MTTSNTHEQPHQPGNDTDRTSASPRHAQINLRRKSWPRHARITLAETPELYLSEEMS